MQNLKFNEEMIRLRLQVYQLLSRYYLNGIANVKYEELLEISFVENMREKAVSPAYQMMIDGLEMVKNGIVLDENKLQGKCDYARLFLGPDKVIAPPYESAYRNPNRLLMQKETLQVRNFYRKLDLEGSAEGSLPDDHLGLELEFLSYLLFQSIQDASNKEEYLSYYNEFLIDHLLKWGIDHCDDVLNHSDTLVCRGMALLLKGLLEIEMKEVGMMVDAGIQGGENDGRTNEII